MGTIRPVNETRLPDPVFILGISERSGTNYLRDLLNLHPDLAATNIVFEDFLVAHSDLLIKYADMVRTRWLLNKRIAEQIGQPDQAIARALGNGLLELLYATSNQPTLAAAGFEEPGAGLPTKRLLTKTPSVEQLPNIFRLFPTAQVIIVVRDGRAVVESGMKTFKWSFEKATHLWANAARTILEFDRQNRGPGQRYQIVRYEDLQGERTEQTLRQLLAFLNLDAGAYDFAGALNLPVKGSSELGAKATDLTSWKPVEKPKDFNPLRRWEHWGPARHERFAWVAGAVMQQLGYSMELPGASPQRFVVNGALDLRWAVREVMRRGYRSLPRNYRRMLAGLR